jgi:acetoin utilization deacetylase AcuC-like enzyme
MIKDVLLFTHPAMLAHGVPPGHPERPERLTAVLRGVEDLPLQRREAPLADRQALIGVHPAAYVDAMDAVFPAAGEGMAALDSGDTFLSDGSREAAYRAAGAVVAAVDAVLAGQARAAFCAVRPPGHHAEPAQPMGFCLFNNVAIGALHALNAHGLARVAVVDFDVHHGNGTQAVALKEPRLLFASTHQRPLYPGTGAAEDQSPHANLINAPLPARTDGAAWRAAMAAHVLPALQAFDPQMVLISAGFDAHSDDPLADLRLQPDDFAWAVGAIRQAAPKAADRIISTLEGGYDLDALAASARAHVQALLAA